MGITPVPGSEQMIVLIWVWGRDPGMRIREQVIYKKALPGEAGTSAGKVAQGGQGGVVSGTAVQG